jgi:hypothetical protein
MSSFTATKWRFRLALGFLIFAAAAAWAASYYHIAYIFSDSARGNEDVAKLLTLVDILSGSLLAALLFAAVFIFRPLVLGLGRQHRILESPYVSSSVRPPPRQKTIERPSEGVAW